MVRRKKKILIDGKEIEVEIFDTKIAFGSGEEMDDIENLFKEEKIEKKIQEILRAIGAVAKKYTNKEKNLDYYSDVGKILQFVDEEEITNQRGLVWERMAYNLRPDLFSGKKKNSTESKRHPEFMYLLAKQPGKKLHRANWDQWYEMMKFPTVRKNPGILEKILLICETKKPSGKKLRDIIKDLLKRSD